MPSVALSVDGPSADAGVVATFVEVPCVALVSPQCKSE